MSAEQQVMDRLSSFHEDWIKMNFAKGENFEEVWDEVDIPLHLLLPRARYFADGCLVIRPSGNRLSWRALIMLDDVEYNKNMEDHRLVSIDSCVVFADRKAAVTTFTMDIYVVYKGVQNEDRAKVSLTWTRDGGKWKIIHFHCATGQPVPKE